MGKRIYWAPLDKPLKIGNKEIYPGFIDPLVKNRFQNLDPNTTVRDGVYPGFSCDFGFLPLGDIEIGEVTTYQHKCFCNTLTLMNTGCKCGGI